MTFIKYEIRGQAVTEYFILTAILVGILLVFATKGFFTNSHQGLDDLFNTSVNRILR